MSYTDLAKATGLSTSAAHQRVRRLEERGVIRGYAAVVDPDAVGLPLTAFISVTPLDPAAPDDVAERLATDRADRGLPLGRRGGELHPQGPGRRAGRPRGAAGPDPRGRERPDPDDDRPVHAVRSPATRALGCARCHRVPCATSRSTPTTRSPRPPGGPRSPAGASVTTTSPGTRRPGSSHRPACGGPNLLFEQVPEAKTIKNRVHLDIEPDTTRDEEVARLESLGATMCWTAAGSAGRLGLDRHAGPRGQRVLRRAQRG